jgi:hypothetical protein
MNSNQFILMDFRKVNTIFSMSYYFQPFTITRLVHNFGVYSIFGLEPRADTPCIQFLKFSGKQ